VAWLSRNNFTSGEAMSHAYLNNLANDTRAWGGNVNAGGYAIANLVSITGTGDKLGIGTAAPAAAVDVYGGGTLWKNLDPSHELFASTDRVLQVRSAGQAVALLASDVDANGGVLGGVYFVRTQGQNDAHRSIAGIRGVQIGTGSLAGGALAIIVKANSGPYEGARFTAAGLGIGVDPAAQAHLYGIGQTTAAMSNSGARGSVIYLQDAAGASGNGGAVMYGALQGFFAAIKGLLYDGSGSTTGDLAISTRNAASDPALTERVRVTREGRVGIGKAAPGTTLAVANLPTYADNAAATGAGLTAGDVYVTSTGQMMRAF
jgi:hypothetical protein